MIVNVMFCVLDAVRGQTDLRWKVCWGDVGLIGLEGV